MAALVIAALVARRGPSPFELADIRRSTFLSGPGGAKGLADALVRLGVPVERRRRTLFDWSADTAPSASGAVLALLDIQSALTAVEERRLVEYVERGGALFLAGRNFVESCFGAEVQLVGDFPSESIAVLAPGGARALPAARRVLRPAEEAEAARLLRQDRCVPIEPSTVDTVLRATDGRPVAWRLGFPRGGRVIMVADSRYVSNELLKTTDAGVVVLGWLLVKRPSRFVVDEYHQGFGESGTTIFGAAWRWMRRSPGGWAMLQLAFAGLAALALAAVRFGPALRVVERRRRSPMEHLDALAVGLERAEGAAVAVQLIADGLRRRLSRPGTVRPLARGDLDDWLGSLALATERPAARAAVTRLRRLVRERGGHSQVLAAAHAVEDVWQALRPLTKRNGS